MHQHPLSWAAAYTARRGGAAQMPRRGKRRTFLSCGGGGGEPWRPRPGERPIPPPQSGSCLKPSSLLALALPQSMAVEEPSAAASEAAGPLSTVTFAVQRRVEFGQQLKVVGSSPVLGAWEAAAAPGEGEGVAHLAAACCVASFRSRSEGSAHRGSSPRAGARGEGAGPAS